VTEAVFPTLLHQDFRRGAGSGWSRLRYALGQTLWTHHDSSILQFNYSEIVGSVAAVAISNAYYADNGPQVMPLPSSAFKSIPLENILKEFWPDLERKFHRRKR
jgi:hypothetical protein